MLRRAQLAPRIVAAGDAPPGRGDALLGHGAGRRLRVGPRRARPPRVRPHLEQEDAPEYTKVALVLPGDACHRGSSRRRPLLSISGKGDTGVGRESLG